MIRKLTFIIGILTIFGMKLSAQDLMHYGIYVGGSLNTMNLDKAFYYDDSEAFTTLHPGDTSIASVYYLRVKDGNVKFNTGFVFGGFYEYHISEYVGLQFDILINQYGYKLNGEVTQRNLFDNDSVTYNYKSNLKTTNIAAGIYLKIHPIEYLSIDLGVNPAFVFKMIKDVERGVDHKTHAYKIKEDYNPLSVSAAVGVTGYFGDFFVSLRYTQGFTNLLKVKKPYYYSEEGMDSEIRYRYSDAKSIPISIVGTIGFRVGK